MKLKLSSIALISAWSILQTETALAVTERARRHFAAAECSAVPTSVDFNVTALPDLFTFLNGTTVASAADFTCRQAQLDALLQEFELGAKPDKPSVFTASLSGKTITIVAGNGTTNITFTVPITLPTASNATKPFPALIAFDGLSIPQPPDVAVLTLNVDNIALQNDATSRGIGIFFDLYGTDATAGALMAWAWAVSRVIDALEFIPVSQSNIDATKVAVTGCSRDGKGALVAGAFDERVVLTLPQESGSGGSACWRLSDFQFAQGDDVQTAHEIIMENVWFSENFDPFVNATNTLPFDHHSLAALIAPRALFVIDNPAYEWLGPFSCFGCMETARLAWSALGVPDHMGFSQVGNHSHCQFPTPQQGPLLTNFVNKFLFGDTTANTTVTATDAGYTFNLTQWAPWPVPTLDSSTSGRSS